MSRPVVIKFFAPVNEATINSLIDAIDHTIKKMKKGVGDITLLISSTGGSVHHGLSAYNYLKGLPVDVVTHNFGIVDSIGVVLFCGGKTRLCVPEARFLLHGVQVSFPPGVGLEQKQVEEALKGMKIDAENISKVIAANSNKSAKEISSAMRDRTTLSPNQAESWGLVHDIKSKLFTQDAEMISIQVQTPKVRINGEANKQSLSLAR